MVAGSGSQDMPPDGGYKPLQWKRVKIKTVFGTGLTLGVFTAATICGSLGYYYAYKKYQRELVEMRSARFAILPMLVAERDRAFLKQVCKNRNAEKELMKNVPEWKVGTYFGEPVYITQNDKFIEPHYFEFMAHTDFWDANYRHLRRLLM